MCVFHIKTLVGLYAEGVDRVASVNVCVFMGRFIHSALSVQSHLKVQHVLKCVKLTPLM